MKLLCKAGILRLLISVLIACLAPALLAKEPVDSVLDVLVAEINNSAKYKAVKETRLGQLRQSYNESTTPQSRFDYARELFNEYISYQSDSAYRYASEMKRLATEMADPSGEAVSHFALMKYFMLSGYFKEAEDMNNLIDTSLLPGDILIDYYRSCNTFYQNLESYIGGTQSELCQEYQRRRLEYIRLLAEIAPPTSYEYMQNRVVEQTIENPSEERAIEARKRLLERFDLSDHEQAIQHSIIGLSYLLLGDNENAKYHYALSAIHDVRGTVYETTAAKMLAQILYDEGDMNRAYVFIHRAFDDAEFYNSHLRRDELSRAMQLIDSARISWRSKQLWFLVGLLLAIIVMMVSTLVLFVKVRHRNHTIESINAKLQEESENLRIAQGELHSVNEQLKTAIAQLKEVSEIKDQYIAQSLYQSTDFVNHVEEKSKEALRMLKDKQYGELKFLPMMFGIKEERQRILRSFDLAFLRLFPNFINEFNKLFDEENRVALNDDGELPMDVRIFALLRLGITDPARVSKYLNLSTKTVYVYKTKLKSKSPVENSEFETFIANIPKP